MNESLRALLNEQYKLVAELRKENKDLKEWKENLIRADKKKTEHIDELEEEIKKLKEERDSWKDNYMQETRVRMDECKKLKEENEELKEYKAMYEWLCK